MSQKDKDGALGAGEALDKSVREAAENSGRAKRESDAEHLTEATHGIETKDEGRATPCRSGRASAGKASAGSASTPRSRGRR